MSEDNSGFSLTELMIVVLIIAVMITIAVPSFIGAIDSSRERAVEQSLRNALVAARAASADAAGYTDIALADLPAIEQALIWRDGSTASTEPREISVAIDNSQAVITLVALGESGECFMMRDWFSHAPGVEFARVAAYSGLACRGDSGNDAGVSWASSW